MMLERQQQSRKPTMDNIYDELVCYMEWLSNTNHVAEYDLPHKAAELFDYYESRPELAAYTIDEELPRLKNYRVMLGPDGTIVDDRAGISKLLALCETKGSVAHRIVARCANQSLLADLLDLLTGSGSAGDGNDLVRPQYMATVTADSCEFDVVLIDSNPAVAIAGRLLLTLPTSNGERWNVAEIHIQADFVPAADGSVLRYNLESVRPLVNLYSRKGKELLRSTARFLIHIQQQQHTLLQATRRAVSSSKTKALHDSWSPPMLVPTVSKKRLRISSGQQKLTTSQPEAKNTQLQTPIHPHEVLLDYLEESIRGSAMDDDDLGEMRSTLFSTRFNNRRKDLTFMQ